MNDSTLFIQPIADTLSIVRHTNAQFPVELLGLVGVAIGALISIVGSWILAKRQMNFEIQKSLFNKKLEVYLKLTEIIWPGGIKHHTRTSTDETSFPRTYASNKVLSSWLNDLTLFIAANQLIIDRKTLDAYENLSVKILTDLKFIANSSKPENIDITTQEVGSKSADQILKLCSAVHTAGWDYFKKTYKVDL